MNDTNPTAPTALNIIRTTGPTKNGDEAIAAYDKALAALDKMTARMNECKDQVDTAVLGLACATGGKTFCLRGRTYSFAERSGRVFLKDITTENVVSLG